MSFRYIRVPNGQNITREFLETGTYQIEARGKRYSAKMYLESPFDPDNKRMLGVYNVKLINTVFPDLRISVKDTF